jgi:iron(III) transport system substrate-binding protein
VLTTYIFKLTNWSPPLYNTAAAVAIILMAVTGLLVFLQQKVLSGRSYTTVAGKAFRPRNLDLGPWRWFTFALGLVYLLVVVVLPMLALIVAAFRKFMFIRDAASLFDMRQYSLMHFYSIFDNPLTMNSIYNAVEVGIITAVVGGTLAFAIGYTIHRTSVAGRRSIDLVSTLPVAIPGLVIGVAYLWAWIGIPGGLYGTIWILALAFIARFMPDTVKALSTSFLQIHRELEEAAWVCGRGMLGTIRTIVLPLARPGVIASMTLLFVLAIRELGSSLFLYTSNTMVMSVLLLDYYEGGNLGKTAAFSLVQMVLLGVLIGGANWLARGAAQGSIAQRIGRTKGGSAMTKKIVASIVTLAGVAGLGIALSAFPAHAQQFGSPELIAAAKAEGKLVYYTANFAEVEQQVIKEFNKRFPEIKVEMIRAPGGQLITRVKTEAAAGKLIADVVDHSDRALMADLVDMFQDYAPPNAADYNPDAQISPKLWPRATLVWSIAYNTELVKNPPKSWMDLTKPEYDKLIGQVFAQSGGTTWTRVMFERQVLGEDYWAKQAATHPILYPSGAPMADSLVRGEIAMGPLLYNAIYPKQKDGAPIKIFFPPEGAPVNPYASGIPKTAAHPNAAKLFLNWCLSKEGQTFMIKELGNLTSLKVAPVYPEGFDPKVVKVWFPKFDEYVKLHGPWVADWDKIFGYRQ